MATQVRVGGSWLPLTGCQVFASGAWRSIAAIQVFASGAWQQVASFVSTLALGIAPNPFSNSFTSYRSGLPVDGSGTQSLTATPTGGRAPYSYVWSVTSGTATLSATNTATITVTSDTLAQGESSSVSLSCTVTDSLGATANATVSGTFTNAS